MKDAANCEETTPKAVLITYKTSQDTQSDAKNTENKPVKAVFEGENLTPDAICPSTPRRKTCRPIRPSRDIHPIHKSPSFVSVKRRHAVSLRPPRGVQPIMSQPHALAVVGGVNAQGGKYGNVLQAASSALKTPLNSTRHSSAVHR